MRLGELGEQLFKIYDSHYELPARLGSQSTINSRRQDRSQNMQLFQRTYWRTGIVPLELAYFVGTIPKGLGVP